MRIRKRKSISAKGHTLLALFFLVVSSLMMFGLITVFLSEGAVGSMLYITATGLSVFLVIYHGLKARKKRSFSIFTKLLSHSVEIKKP